MSGTPGTAQSLVPRGRRDPLVLWSAGGLAVLLLGVGLIATEDLEAAAAFLAIAALFVVGPAAGVVGLAAVVIASRASGRQVLAGLFAAVGLAGALMCALAVVGGLSTEQEVSLLAGAVIVGVGGAGVALGIAATVRNLASARSGERFARGLRWFAAVVRVSVLLYAAFGAAIFFPIGPLLAIPFAAVCLLAVRRMVRAVR